MRFIKRNIIEIPKVLTFEFVEDHLQEVRSMIILGNYDRPPEFRYKIFHDKELRWLLLEDFKRKCAYCEISVFPGNFSIDHFRPASGAVRKNGDVDSKRYSWLAYEWENLYLACNQCCASKRNNFPISFESKYLETIEKLRYEEGALILDPCFDMPEVHLYVDARGRFVGLTELGITTIDVIDLNRKNLVVERAKKIKAVVDLLQQAMIIYNNNHSYLSHVMDLLTSEFYDDSPFVGTALLIWNDLTQDEKSNRKLFDSHIQFNPDNLNFVNIKKLSEYSRFIGERVSVKLINRLKEDDEIKPLSDAERFAMKYIRKVRIKNFKGIKSLELEFPEQDNKTPPLLCILGDNAVGKTAILQAITIGLLGHETVNTLPLSPISFLHNEEDKGSVEIDFWYSDSRNEVFFDRANKKFTGSKHVPNLVLSYGANRIFAGRTPRAKNVGFDYRVQSIFDEKALIKGAFGFHKNHSDHKILENAASTIKSLLSDEKATVDFDGNKRLIIKDEFGIHHLENLSAGYRTIVGMAMDIMDVLYKRWSGTESSQAIVIIDEIDTHLHPVWRLKIVEAFRKAFPFVQFVFSTHDPLILRGMKNQEIRTLSKNHSAKFPLEKTLQMLKDYK